MLPHLPTECNTLELSQSRGQDRRQSRDCYGFGRRLKDSRPPDDPSQWPVRSPHSTGLADNQDLRLKGSQVTRPTYKPLAKKSPNVLVQVIT